MGSPLGPTLANIFLCHHETTWSKVFEPGYYKRYIDDIFVLFEEPEQVLRFVNYMNKRHKDVKFLSEAEKDNSFSFLSVKICKEKGKFKTSVFKKDMSSRVYTNFCSFAALEHKFRLVYTLVNSIVNNIFVQKPVVTTIPKLELRIASPYIGNISSITKKRLYWCTKRLKFCKLEIIFQISNRLKNYFRFKDCVPETLPPNFFYKFK